MDLLQPDGFQTFTQFCDPVEMYLVQKAVRDLLAQTQALINGEEVDTKASRKGKRRQRKVRKKGDGVASDGSGTDPPAVKDATAKASSLKSDGPDKVRGVPLVQTSGQGVPMGLLSRSAASSLSGGGQTNGKSPTAVDTATTIQMSRTEPSLSEFTDPNEMAVRVRVTPLLTLDVEGGQLHQTKRVEALLVYQAERVYPDSPPLRGASSEWTETYWAARNNQEVTKEPFVLKMENSSDKTHWAVFLPPVHRYAASKAQEMRQAQVGQVLRMVTGTTTQGDPPAVPCEALLIGLWAQDVVVATRLVLEEVGQWMAWVNSAQTEKCRGLRHIGLVPDAISRQDLPALRIAVEECLPVRPFELRGPEAVFEMALPLEPVSQLLGPTRAGKGLTLEDREGQRMLAGRFLEVEHVTEASRRKTIVRKIPIDPKLDAGLEGVDALARLLTNLALETKDECGRGFTHLYVRCSSAGLDSARSTPSLDDTTSGPNAGPTVPRPLPLETCAEETDLPATKGLRHLIRPVSRLRRVEVVALQTWFDFRALPRLDIQTGQKVVTTKQLNDLLTIWEKYCSPQTMGELVDRAAGPSSGTKGPNKKQFAWQGVFWLMQAVVNEWNPAWRVDCLYDLLMIHDGEVIDRLKQAQELEISDAELAEVTKQHVQRLFEGDLSEVKGICELDNEDLLWERGLAGQYEPCGHLGCTRPVALDCQRLCGMEGSGQVTSQCGPCMLMAHYPSKSGTSDLYGVTCAGCSESQVGSVEAARTFRFPYGPQEFFVTPVPENRYGVLTVPTNGGPHRWGVFCESQVPKNLCPGAARVHREAVCWSCGVGTRGVPNCMPCACCNRWYHENCFLSGGPNKGQCSVCAQTHDFGGQLRRKGMNPLQLGAAVHGVKGGVPRFLLVEDRRADGASYQGWHDSFAEATEQLLNRLGDTSESAGEVRQELLRAADALPTLTDAPSGFLRAPDLTWMPVGKRKCQIDVISDQCEPGPYLRECVGFGGTFGLVLAMHSDRPGGGLWTPGGLERRQVNIAAKSPEQRWLSRCLNWAVRSEPSTMGGMVQERGHGGVGLSRGAR